MAKPRASIFDNTEDFDVSGFKPTATAETAPPTDQVRAIAEASNFPSREPRKPSQPLQAAEAVPMPKRTPRRHRTGRTAQFNARTTPETVEAFYAIADRKGWLIGETVEHALAALERELQTEQ
jgi:hypothetical protein